MPSSIMTKQADEVQIHPTAKPINIFYIWYSELCRRQNMQPLSMVKPAKPKNETILDFVSDRIKPEEWTPIINALRLDTSLHVIAIRSRVQCKFLYDVDTEEKARQMKRRAGSIFTTYILKSLLKALGNCIKRNDVLSSLEVDGIPIGIDYIETIVDALKKNKTIKVLTLKYCTLRDLGCQMLCTALRNIPNIEVLNLTACGLGPVSAQYIAKVVKFQQINRYCESWHNSLRYEDPEVGIMAGLKRITLNNNPTMGDEGLTYILDELDDDLWIKAIDMQRCGITENIASRLLDVIEYSRSLEVADFRCNEQLSQQTIERVLDILKNKQRFGYENQFQWCYTATTLDDPPVVHETISTTSTSKPPIKSKSVPFRNMHGSNGGTASSNTTIPLRRMKTCTSINKKAVPPPDKFSSLSMKNTIDDAKLEVLQLNEELQKEVAKRIQSELENKKLKQELDKIKSSCNLNENYGSSNNHHKEKVVKFDPVPLQDTIVSTKRTSKSKSAKTLKSKPTKVEFVFEGKNQTAHNILQNIVNKNMSNGNESESELDYFKDILEETKNSKNCDRDVDESTNGSNSSLIKFMKEIKSSTENNGSSDSHLWNTNHKNCLRKVCVR